MRKELKELMLTRAAWTCVLILIVIAARTIIFYARDPATLTYGSIAGHEWEYNIWRIMGMAYALMDGMPGRWLEAFSHGWGYPLFHYTGPLPYFFGGPLVLLGFEPHAALNVCWVAGYAFAGIAMYWAMQPFLGRWGALLATCCYLLAPYHLVDTYVRTNLAETWAFIPPPLIIGGLLRARNTPIPAIAIGSLGVMLLALIHLLSFYIFGMCLGIFCLLYLLLLHTRKERIAFLISASAIGAIGLGLSAFFWLPAFADVSAVKGFEAMATYRYADHFVYLHQLFSSFWQYGGSEPGAQDYMSYSLGQSIVAFGVAALGISLYRLGKSYWSTRKSNRKVTRPKPKLKLIKRGKKVARPKRRKKPVLNFDLFRLVVAVALSTAIAAFLTLSASSSLWNIIPGMGAVQFPWRFLLPASTFLAITAGALPRLLAELNRKLRVHEPLLALILCVIVVGLHWNFAKVGDYGVSERDTMQREGLIELGVWTTSALEFLPRTSLQIPYKEMKRQEIALFYDEDMTPQPRIVKKTMDNGTVRITLLPGNPGTLVVNQHWHPAWNASVDGDIVDAFAFPWHPFGPLAVTVPQGASTVEFRYGYTAAGYFGVLLSLGTLLGAFAYLLKRKKHRQTFLVPGTVFCLTPILLWHLAVTIPDTSTLAERIDGIGNKIDAAELPAIRYNGSSWDEPGNAIFDEEGLRVYLDKAVHDNSITLSTDSNDEYLILYLNGDKVLGRSLIPRRNFGGLSSATLSVSPQATEAGYDSIVILPIDGDNYYSLGHIQTSSEQVAADTDVSQDNIVAPVILPLEQVSTPKPKNIAWDAPGNQILQPQTELRLMLDRPHHTANIELSVDSNDYYFVKYLLAGKFLDGHLVQPVEGYGMGIHRLEVPEKALENGFDAIGIIPLSGDGRYGLAHLMLHEQ
jgi:hypothetical protein